MKRHKKPDLTVLHPLPDSVARALLDAGYQSSVVDDAVEDLPPHHRVQAGQSGGGGRVGVLRRGSRAIVAHRASERQDAGIVAIVGMDGCVTGSGSGGAHV